MLLDSAVYSETSSPSAALARQLPAKLRQGFHVFENNRDMYGFAVRPQHLQRYRKYASIYKEEETERSERWELFLRTYGEENALDSSTLSPSEMALDNKNSEKLDSEDALYEVRASFNSSEDQTEKSAGADKNVNEKIREMQIWGELRPSLKALGQNFGKFLKRRKETEIASSNNSQGQLPTLESQNLTYASTTDAHGFVDVSVDVQVKLSSPLEVGIPLPEVSEGAQDKDPKYPSSSEEGSEGADARTEGADAVNGSNEGCNILVEKQEEVWNDEELRSLVRGGVPMALRGELWQVFAGTQESRTEGLYNKLLNESGPASSGMIEKWKNQIEKDLPRTFPGHPSLDEDGRNALRRLLTAYARHSPEVGYCQAMNFFAALLLLLMPEENAFWTLTAIINDYFEGFYSEKMLEAQVDQLVFGDLVKENFPKLISHLEALGVQVTWVSGTWFLSIFVNVLPWESVLRVWDVLLFDGNRSMLFRTALALMDIHAPTLMAAHDAGDAITLLQSMAGSTFDSSQLVFTACMGFQTINEQKIHSLRLKHRPDVIASLQQRSLELQLWRTSQKSMRRRSPQNVFKVGPAGGMLKAESGTMQLEGKEDNSGLSNRLETANGAVDDKAFGSNELSPSDTAFLHTSLQIGVMDDDEESDLQEQIFWLKTELCRALEEKNSALIRAEELELALMEIVKEDNRRLLTAKLEKLEHEVAALNQEILDKEEQERAMLQVMLRMEQEQKVTEDARRFAEEDAALQRHAANILQEKYEKSMKELALMEKRAVMAESTLEATMQYQALDNTSQNSPRQFQSSFKGEESKRRLWPLGSSARNIQSTVLNSKPYLASPRANLNLNVAGDDATDLKLVDKGTFQESSETKIS